MSDGAHANVGEVLAREQAQRAAVDVVLAEERDVPARACRSTRRSAMALGGGRAEGATLVWRAERGVRGEGAVARAKPLADIISAPSRERRGRGRRLHNGRSRRRGLGQRGRGRRRHCRGGGTAAAALVAAAAATAATAAATAAACTAARGPPSGRRSGDRSGDGGGGAALLRLGRRRLGRAAPSPREQAREQPAARRLRRELTKGRCRGRLCAGLGRAGGGRQVPGGPRGGLVREGRCRREGSRRRERSRRRDGFR